MIKNPMPATKVSAAAERMRRHRQRRRQGIRSLQVLLRETEVDLLVETGLLEERSRNDPNAVIHALHHILDHVFGRARRNLARNAN
jgi:hypothetical protein